MKQIKKGATPRELKEWFKKPPIENGKPLNRHYGDLQSPEKPIVEDQLLRDQGWLCCYTGMTLVGDNFHIEHLIPQAVSRRNETYEDVDYQNMMAAYPKGNTCPFGARVRADKPLKIHPLQPTCHTKFRFDFEGRILGIDQDAKDTIATLKLDHDMLTEMRKMAIDEALFPDNHPISESKAQSIADRYCSTDKLGRYPRFCFVVAQAAQEYLHKIERERKRRQAIQSQAKR